jgi:quinol monooxygenase YgiN
MAVIAVTRLRLRSVWFFLPFAYWARMSAAQALRAPGNLGVDLLRDAHLAFWTKSAWKDEDSMRAYMMTHPHQTVMKMLPDWCSEAAVVHWKQEAAALPDWREAHRRLASEGRRSPVKHPSLGQERFEIAPPRM